MAMMPVWKDNYVVKAYESGPSGTSHLTALCDCIQETAGHHAEHLGLGLTHLAAQHQIWVLSRFSIRMERYPRMFEKFRVETWPRGLEGLLAMRDFEVFDSMDRRLAGASSGWIVLDLETKRPQRIIDYDLKIPLRPDRRALGKKLEKLPGASQGNLSNTIKVGYSDLDNNRHVNNVKYIGWIVDHMYTILSLDQRCTGFDINFLSECYINEILVITSAPVPGQENTFHHSILRQDDQREVCRARSIWSNGVS
jgi:medium-chain acyl-[acyl-carrier-protein] hydrolase